MLYNTLIFKNLSLQPPLQVNSKAAEVVYQTVGELADLSPSVCLVDVCCGTGTIGLCLAGQAKKVVGVELIPAAVRDARRNAEVGFYNDVTTYAGVHENRFPRADASPIETGLNADRNSPLRSHLRGDAGETDISLDFHPSTTIFVLAAHLITFSANFPPESKPLVLVSLLKILWTGVG